jgi:hypothetical protein
MTIKPAIPLAKNNCEKKLFCQGEKMNWFLVSKYAHFLADAQPPSCGPQG